MTRDEIQTIQRALEKIVNHCVDPGEPCDTCVLRSLRHCEKWIYSSLLAFISYQGDIIKSLEDDTHADPDVRLKK